MDALRQGSASKNVTHIVPQVSIAGQNDVNKKGGKSCSSLELRGASSAEKRCLVVVCVGLRRAR